MLKLNERNDRMNNLQRLELEVKGVELEQTEMVIYLEENGLSPHEEYNAESATSKKKIYQSALSVLESIANDPSRFADTSKDDFNLSNFATNIQNRIDQLERKVRKLKTDEQVQNDTNTFMLFGE